MLRSGRTALFYGSLAACLVSAGACSLVNAPEDAQDPTTTVGSGGAGPGGSDPGGMGGMGGAEPVCGDGIVNGTEQCDDSGESATCNDDCTDAMCGDGKVNGSANEQCDMTTETTTCNADCTVAQCGDDYINTVAGEQCDSANAIMAGCCSSNNCNFTQNCSNPTLIPLMPNGMGQAVGNAMCPLGGLGEVSNAACDGNPAIGAGPEHIYTFELVEPASVQITVNSDFDAVIRLTTIACNVDSEVPEGPTEDGCSNEEGANTPEILDYAALGSGSYFLIVEGATPQDVGVFDVQVQAEPLVNPILNPSFETGDYTNWTLSQESGQSSATIMVVVPASTINQGQTFVDMFDNQPETASSFNLPITATPSEGQFVTAWLSNGPDRRRMYQDLMVSGNTLTFDMAHASDANWDNNNQYIAVNVRDPQTDALIATPFKTSGAFPLMNLAMTQITVPLNPFTGQTVRLDIEVQGQNDFLEVLFDNFVIQ